MKRVRQKSHSIILLIDRKTYSCIIPTITLESHRKLFCLITTVIVVIIETGRLTRNHIPAGNLSPD